MSLVARFEEQQPGAERRGAGRIILRLEAEGSIPQGEPGRVLIHDLSKTGALIETSAAPKVGSKLEVVMLGGEAVDARVVWRSGRFFGCQFLKPISAASLSAAMLRSPHIADQRRPPATKAAAQAELVELRKAVQRISDKVEGLLERLASTKVHITSATFSADRVDAIEPEAPVEARFPVRTRLRFLFAGSILLWGLLLGVFFAF